MKHILTYTFLFCFLVSQCLAAGHLQDNDFATPAYITGSGGTLDQLLNEDKLWSNSLAEQYSTALGAGDIFNKSQPMNAAQLATPANPAAGFNKLYFKAGNGLYTLDSAGNEAQVLAPTGGVLPIANGGTNASSFTAGSVPFIGAGGTSFSENNASLFWDNVTNSLGIGTNTPGKQLDLVGDARFTNSKTDVSATGTQSTNLVTVNAAPSASIGAIVKANISVTAPVGNGNSVTGLTAAAWRDQGAADTDLVDSMYALEASAAHVNTNATAHTNLMAGLHLGNAVVSGTVDDLYDIYADDQGSTPALITNRYGIYLAPDGAYVKKNWLSGLTQIGGSSFTAPTESLVVSGNEQISGNIKDNAAVVSVDPNGRTLNEATGVAVVDYGAQVLGDTTNSSVHWSTRTLDNAAGVPVVDWASQVLGDSTPAASLDWSQRLLYDTAGAGSVSLNWQNRQLISGGVNKLDWLNNAIYDNATVASIDWGNRFLVDSGGNVTLDYSAVGTIQSHAAIDMNSHLINNVTDPVNPQDAATKAYVDAAVGGGGGGGASALQMLEQKADNERSGFGPSDPLDNSVGTGFGRLPNDYLIKGVLMSPYTAGGTTLDLVWDPKVLSTADPNTASTTGWGGFSAAGSVTTSTNIRVGTTTAISFDKTNAGVFSGIQYDFGSNTFSTNGYSTVYYNIYLPSTVGLANVSLYVTSDNTNIQQFTTTTQSDGSPLVGGQYNNVKFDLTTTGTVNAGTGWAYPSPFRYMAPGIETTVAGTTYSGILISGLWLENVNFAQFVQKGYEFDIYGAGNSEDVQIDSASGAVEGLGVTISSALANNYIGGIGVDEGTIYRNTLSIGRFQATMGYQNQEGVTVTGTAALQQTGRLAINLRSSLAAQTVGAFIDVNTPQVYRVTAVAPGSVDVYDPADTSGDLLSGETMLDFETLPNGQSTNRDFRNSAAMNGNASHSGNTTTLSFAVNPVGIAVGDYIVKDHLSASYSAAAFAANENFASLAASIVAAPDGYLLEDQGVSIPQATKVFSYWSLSGAQGTTNNYGPGANLTQTGTLTNGNDFLAGAYSSSGFVTNTNFYGITAPQSLPINNKSQIAVSLWLFPVGCGTGRGILGMTDTGGTNGWGMNYGATGTCTVEIGNASGIARSGVVLNTGQWNHIVGQFKSGVANGTQIYVNGALVQTGTFTVSSTTQGLALGQSGNPSDSWLGTSLSSSDKLAQVVIWEGTQLTADEVAQIYNNGKAQILGFSPNLKYRYSIPGVSGQHLGLKARLNRDTTGVTPFIRKYGIIRM